MAGQKKPVVSRTVKPKANRFEIDEVRVQVIVREIDGNGETVAKHAAEPLAFVNERAFREWAQQPFKINRREDAPA